MSHFLLVDLLKQADLGLPIVTQAAVSTPPLLMQILEAGWGRVVARENQQVSRSFLANLRRMEEPKEAVRALNLFFRGASHALVTDLVMGSIHGGEPPAAMVQWLGRCKPGVEAALIERTAELGADLESSLTHRAWHGFQSVPGAHSVLSATVAKSMGSTSLWVNGRLSEVDTASAMSLIKAGKQFDVQSAKTILGLPRGKGVAWFKFLAEDCGVGASKILEVTADLPMVDNVKAMLRSMEALQAINELLLPVAQVPALGASSPSRMRV